MRKGKYPLRSSRRVKNSGNGGEQIGNRLLIIGYRVRKDDRMGFGMRKIKTAAKDVAKLVVKRHADLT